MNARARIYVSDEASSSSISMKESPAVSLNPLINRKVSLR